MGEKKSKVEWYESRRNIWKSLIYMSKERKGELTPNYSSILCIVILEQKQFWFIVIYLERLNIKNFSSSKK